MTSNVDSVLLSLLSREPTILEHSSVARNLNEETCSIKGIKYNLVSSTLDMNLQETNSALQAARIILTVRKAVDNNDDNNSNSNSNSSEWASPKTEHVHPTTELAAHIFTRPQGSTPTSTLIPHTIIDTDALHSSSTQPTTALRASTTIPPTNPNRALSSSSSSSSSSSPQTPTPTPTQRRPTLRETYHDYIATINAGAAAMTSLLPGFCHPVVTHNGQALPLPRYQRLMEDAQEAIPDIVFRVADLIVDEEKGQVAVRLEFTGTPVRAWAGVEPDGKKVNFSEQAFYWFEAGRIRSVVSLLDMDAYRKHMRA